MYICSGTYTSSTSNYRYNFNEYNWKINRIRNINGVDYIEYWAGKNYVNSCSSTGTGFTGFYKGSCVSGSATVPASDTADGNFANLTVMQPLSIAFDLSGNCYYYDYNTKYVRKIRAIDQRVYTVTGSSTYSSFYGISPDTITRNDPHDWITNSDRNNDDWYNGGNHAINSDYFVLYCRVMDTDIYGNLYYLNDGMIMKYNVEGDNREG